MQRSGIDTIKYHRTCNISKRNALRLLSHVNLTVHLLILLKNGTDQKRLYSETVVILAMFIVCSFIRSSKEWDMSNYIAQRLYS